FVFITAGWTWMKFFQSGSDPASVTGWMMLGLIGGFIFAMVTIFKQEWAPVTASLYALCEGFFIGGVSSLFEAKYPGITIQAAALTFGTLLSMLVAYRSGAIRATEGFKLGVVAATGGIALFYFIAIILSFFGIPVSIIYEGGVLGIAFSLFVVAIAALNLVIDFDLIEQGARRGAPKYMEWYGSFALMVTLIWLYIEFLRLLSKARSR
ncbi:MAG: Bax inhibitor-1/YccA family protein, partial [Waddliaceae bacterium]